MSVLYRDDCSLKPKILILLVSLVLLLPGSVAYQRIIQADEAPPSTLSPYSPEGSLALSSWSVERMRSAVGSLQNFTRGCSDDYIEGQRIACLETVIDGMIQICRLTRATWQALIPTLIYYRAQLIRRGDVMSRLLGQFQKLDQKAREMEGGAPEKMRLRIFKSMAVETMVPDPRQLLFSPLLLQRKGEQPYRRLLHTGLGGMLLHGLARLIVDRIVYLEKLALFDRTTNEPLSQRQETAQSIMATIEAHQLKRNRLVELLMENFGDRVGVQDVKLLTDFYHECFEQPLFNLYSELEPMDERLAMPELFQPLELLPCRFLLPRVASVQPLQEWLGQHAAMDAAELCDLAPDEPRRINAIGRVTGAVWEALDTPMLRAIEHDWTLSVDDRKLQELIAPHMQFLLQRVLPELRGYVDFIAIYNADNQLLPLIARVWRLIQAMGGWLQRQPHHLPDRPRQCQEYGTLVRTIRYVAQHVAFADKTPLPSVTDPVVDDDNLMDTDE